ncbi:YdcF family protein [Candidatus Arthromitus sp. SFB-turkey]|uniref:YdcF family protein n=1 Tax=Candidatus Arthromitus sp. SFB-turkey TaxID=1840217 RepID=UPI001FA7A916|nr:YdcF family protein [Candidatus Arthromitus sp. SFB-turkey]
MYIVFKILLEIILNFSKISLNAEGEMMIFLLGLIILCLVMFFLILYLVLKYEKSNCEKFCEYVLVLGARILDEDTPCKVLENRLISAIIYLHKFENSKVIVSGGTGIDEPISEGYVMKKYLINHGIDKHRIFVEDLSTNTFENLKNTKQILKDVDEILIITSKYHLFRSKILARRVGFRNIYLIGSEVNASNRQKNIIREIFAVIKSIFFDW